MNLCEKVGEIAGVQKNTERTRRGKKYGRMEMTTKKKKKKKKKVREKEGRQERAQERK